MKVALFAPCYVDQLYPQVGIAAVRVLERLGIDVAVPTGAACCGQPMANAGFSHEAEQVIAPFVETFASYEAVVVLSGSCALHVKQHAGAVGSAGAQVAARTVEFCAFLHDTVGVDRMASLGAAFPKRVGVHIGCHGLRGLCVARPTELQIAPFDKVRSILGTVQGLSIAELARPDECCGFGGTFAVGEPAVSVKMGRDRLRQFSTAHAEAIVTTDMSCGMHLDGLSRRSTAPVPVLHVAQLFDGVTT